jgi:hypothetical protein
MIAFALAADAGLNALSERSGLGYRALGLVLARWLLAAGWLAFAALLLHTPLAYPDTLRALITALIGAAAVLRVIDSNTRRGCVAPGLALGSAWVARSMRRRAALLRGTRPGIRGARDLSLSEP